MNKNFRIIIAFLLVFIFHGLTQADSVQSACTSKTVAYWSFDSDASEGCGVTALDGTFVGSAAVDSSNIAPLPGNAGSLVLYGAPDRVDLQAPFASSIGALSQGTIESWVYLEDPAGGDIFNHGIAAVYTDLNVGAGSAPSGGFQAYISMPYSAGISFSLPGFSLSTWHHLAWTWDGSEVSTYMDGNLLGSQPNTQTVPFTGNEAEIGSDDQEVSYFIGRIDEVRISNAVLSPDEMLWAQNVEIDIKPGSDPNSINLKSKGVIPVAILTTDVFDATTVDPLSVEFGSDGAVEAHGQGHIEYVNEDGYLDLVLHFITQETGIQCGDTEAVLTGETYGGQAIEGFDSINIVRCR